MNQIQKEYKTAIEDIRDILEDVKKNILVKNYNMATKNIIYCIDIADYMIWLGTNDVTLLIDLLDDMDALREVIYP